MTQADPLQRMLETTLIRFLRVGICFCGVAHDVEVWVQVRGWEKYRNLFGEAYATENDIGPPDVFGNT